MSYNDVVSSLSQSIRCRLFVYRPFRGCRLLHSSHSHSLSRFSGNPGLIFEFKSICFYFSRFQKIAIRYLNAGLQQQPQKEENSTLKEQEKIRMIRFMPRIILKIPSSIITINFNEEKMTEHQPDNTTIECFDLLKTKNPFSQFLSLNYRYQNGYRDSMQCKK